MRRLFGTDGIRGIAGEELSVERAMQIGRAIAITLSKGYRCKIRIAVGRDTRISSEMLESAIISGLRSGGADTVTFGIVPTPAVAYLTVKNRLDAGIMISASHNPYQYNGIKVFGRDGFKISDEAEESIESIVLDNNPPLSICKKSEFELIF
jgi:phosphoglucosamine mutase